MTREQILGLKVGDVLEQTIDSRNGQPLPGARWGFRGAVTEIFAQSVNVKGKAFACFYTSFGDQGATMSGSVVEGENVVRFAA